MKILTLFLSSALLIAVSASAIAAEQSTGENRCTEERMSKRLSRLDSDGDGKISDKEIDAMRTRPVGRSDKDGDGELSLEEYQTGSRGQSKEGAEKRFALMDADKNGKISSAENAAYQKDNMKKLDTDKDGFVTVQEMVASCTPKKPTE